MPMISVIVPVYKVEKYIHRCIDSILAQTFTNFELILVDDGSPDNCGAICDEYAAKDARIHVIHQENGGLSAARNAGIDWAFANSDSQWLTFIDSDDWVHPQYVEALYSAVQKCAVAVSICGYIETTGEEVFAKEAELQAELHPVEQFYVERNVNATVAWGKLYAKDCFKSIRYPVGKIHEDEFVTYRILFEFDKIAFLPAPLYAYYQNPEGITGGGWRPEKMQVIEAVEQQMEYLKEVRLEKAYCHSVKKYAACLANQIFLLAQQPWRIRCKIVPGSRWKLRWILCRCRAYMPLERFPWVYERAFPVLMLIYWIVRAQIRKIKRNSGD